MFRFLGVTLLLSAAVWAGKPKSTGPFKNEDQKVEVSATVILDREQIKQLIGSDLDGHYVLVNVTVTPKYGEQIDLRRDNFLLRTDKDGERSTPYVGSQIAGKGALVVSQGSGNAGMAGPQFGNPYDYPAWGPGVGGPPTQITSAQGKVVSDKGDAPLVKTLNEKMLPEKKTDAPVSGLLYFPLEKQKQKDLELIYTDGESKLSLRFR